jgi:hypothetical protein
MTLARLAKARARATALQVSEGEVTIEAAALWFPTGQHLLDYVQEVAVELHRDEVEP